MWIADPLWREQDTGGRRPSAQCSRGRSLKSLARQGRVSLDRRVCTPVHVLGRRAQRRRSREQGQASVQQTQVSHTQGSIPGIETQRAGKCGPKPMSCFSRKRTCFSSVCSFVTVFPCISFLGVFWGAGGRASDVHASPVFILFA